MNEKNLNIINKTGNNIYCPVPFDLINEYFLKEKDIDSVSLVFLTKEEMKNINQLYRDKNYPTDVLTFPDEDNRGGDIIFCTKEINQYAKKNNIPASIRWWHLFIHSLTHLEGYDHHTIEGASEMFLKESARWARLQKMFEIRWIITNSYQYIYQPR